MHTYIQRRSSSTFFGTSENPSYTAPSIPRSSCPTSRLKQRCGPYNVQSFDEVQISHACIHTHTHTHTPTSRLKQRRGVQNVQNFDKVQISNACIHTYTHTYSYFSTHTTMCMQSFDDIINIKCMHTYTHTLSLLLLDSCNDVLHTVCRASTR
jgi:hypothetical protein